MPFVTSDSAAGTISPTVNLNVAGTDLWLVIEVTVEDGAVSATCTVNGVAQPTTAWDGTSGVIASNGINNRVYGLRNPPTGASVPIVNTAAGGAPKGVLAALYDAVDQATPFDNLQTSTATVTSISVTVPSAAANLVVGGVIASAGGGPQPVTPGAGQTGRSLTSVGDFSHIAVSDEAGGASTLHSYTRAADANFGSLLWALNLRASAGSGGPSATPALGRWRRVGPAR